MLPCFGLPLPLCSLFSLPWLSCHKVCVHRTGLNKSWSRWRSCRLLKGRGCRLDTKLGCGWGPPMCWTYTLDLTEKRGNRMVDYYQTFEQINLILLCIYHPLFLIRNIKMVNVSLMEQEGVIWAFIFQEGPWYDNYVSIMKRPHEMLLCSNIILVT